MDEDKELPTRDLFLQANRVKKEPNHKRHKYSEIGFMAFYEPKENADLTSEKDVITDCKKRYYKKRRYRCPGKRRYKAKVGKRCCGRKYNNNRINLCNRNWARISIYPFINFLRCYRKRFHRNTPPSEIARKGRCEWRKLTCRGKEKYYEQAKRARIRGYRT